MFVFVCSGRTRRLLGRSLVSGDFDTGKSVPPFCHCHVRVGFFVGLADSLGKNSESGRTWRWLGVSSVILEVVNRNSNDRFLILEYRKVSSPFCHCHFHLPCTYLACLSVFSWSNRQ